MTLLKFLLLLLLVVPSRCVHDDEVSALVAFKQAISEDPLSKLSDWNTLSGDPCSWSGVTCSKSQNHVISLNLSNSSLRGFLVPELGSLIFLQELILANNLLYGTIPKSIGILKSLTTLDLSMNRLVGPIPSEIGDLSRITKINVRSNGLTGGIPPELGNLVSLVELHLDRNRLSGPIPGSKNSKSSPTVNGRFVFHKNSTGLCQSPRLKVGDFSYNFLVGKIPSCLKYLPTSSFQGNCFDSILQLSTQQCSSVKKQEVPKDSYIDSNDGHKHQKPRQPVWLLILEITTGALVAVFLTTYIATAVKRCKPKSSVIFPWKRTINWKDHISISIDDELLKNVLRLNCHELEIACEDFSNIIGSSSDSKVYKGTMKNGPEIAVVSLCISENHWTSYLELYFQRKVADLSRLDHLNTTKLLGYCKESDPFSRMLVFEYASNGTLYEHLHYGEVCQLSWLRRMKIAIGIARGLRYLHTELQPPLTIFELNSNSVYFTEDFSPKLVDFESWKSILLKSEYSDYITNGVHFSGFVNSVERRHMDVQGNTYAFGVLLLELITGRPSYCKDNGDLVDWAAQYLPHPGRIGMLVDPELENVKADDLSIICGVVSLCIEPDTSKRPSMQIISAILEDGIDTLSVALPKESPLAWAELALSS